MRKRVSPYNLMGLSAQYIKKDIYFCDVTLRDGEQTAGVNFTVEDKMKVAQMLDEIGFKQIQTGAIRSDVDYQAAKALSGLKLNNAKIEVMTAAFSANWKKEVLKAIESGGDIIHTLVPLSPYIRGMYASIPDEEYLFNHIRETIEFMRANGAPCINVSLLDATRCSEELLVSMAKILCEYKVERMRFADTVGTANPLSIYHIVRLFLNTFAQIGDYAPKLGVHLHDDFGLATANALAAVAAGADYIDLSVNGLGERAGNPDTTQVVMALEALCDINTGIQTEKFYELSRYIEKISGIPIPSNKPLIGNYAFSDESDSHVKASSTDPFAYQGILPEAVGGHRKLILGSKSGINAIRTKIQQMGLEEGDDEFYKKILSIVKKETSKLRGTIMSDESFEEIVKSVRSEI